MNSGIIIQEEINNFYNIFEASKILNENNIILEFDINTFKQRIQKLFDKIINRANAILKWIKDNIIDKVIAGGKKIWEKLIKFDKAEEQVNKKIEETKKENEVTIEVKEKVKTLEEEIADFLDEKVNVDIMEDNSPLGKLKGAEFGAFGSKIFKPDVIGKVTERDNRSIVYTLFDHYDFSNCKVTRRKLHHELKFYSNISKFMKDGYHGKVLDFASEIENEIKILEDKKKNIENRNLENSTLEDIADKNKDLKFITESIEYCNRCLSFYQKVLGYFTTNYKNIIKAEGEYVTFFNKMKAKLEASDNTNDSNEENTK